MLLSDSCLKVAVWKIGTLLDLWYLSAPSPASVYTSSVSMAYCRLCRGEDRAGGGGGSSVSGDVLSFYRLRASSLKDIFVGIARTVVVKGGTCESTVTISRIQCDSGMCHGQGLGHVIWRFDHPEEQVMQPIKSE